ncbi:MAG: ExbD/TolR family protein [Planctomycetota bacterium]
MARRIQHTGNEPRFEMTPLMDVIFLLLTFFIYTMVVTVRAQVLPVALPQLTTGQIAENVEIAGITVDQNGALFLNRQPITMDQLERRLRQLATQPQPPRFFIASDAQAAQTDRLPAFLTLIDMMRRVGIEEYYLVGQPNSGATPDSNPGATPTPGGASTPPD